MENQYRIPAQVSALSRYMGTTICSQVPKVQGELHLGQVRTLAPLRRGTNQASKIKAKFLLSPPKADVVISV